jgi:DNA-binding transcriptional LysR family regulator
MVRLGVMDDYGTVLLPPLLANFAAEYPHIAIEMETGLASGMKTRLGTDFDIVISIHPEGRGGGTFLRHEQPVWAAGFSHATEKYDPIPIALYPQGCLFRKWGVDSLNASDRRWRLAYVSHSLAAVEAIAALGLAITIMKSGTFPDRLRPLSENDGMPALPMSDVRLHRVTKPPKATALLTDYIVSHLKRPK